MGGEKESDIIAGSQGVHEDSSSIRIGEQKPAAGVTGEAIEIYKDVETAQRLGYVHRGLKSRHLQFMAIGGTIGTGLFLGIGGAFVKGGPLSVLLGFSITGVAVWAMMMGLGEMATWLPLPGSIPQYCSRYVDPAMGFAVGWNTWYLCALAVCGEISAAAVLVGFWDTDTSINPAVWVSILIPILIALNIFAVSIYGEAEFIFASIKMVTIVGLLLMSFIVDLGGSPSGDRLGFRYWYNPGPAMKEWVAEGHTGRFLGLFSTLVYAAFSYAGIEMIAVAAGETQDPRRNVPKAVRRLFWRILLFYVGGSLAIGVLVPSDHEDLGSVSPWVLACQIAGIPVLPHIINAVILSSAASSGNAFIYVGARYLFGLAAQKQAPQIFLKCTKRGVPIYAVGFTALWSGLAYMAVSAGASQVFQWFLSLGTVAALFTWCSLTIAFIRFKKALAKQGVDRNTLVYKSPFQPYAAWFALCYFAMIILFNGWEVFTTGRWNIQGFITAYLGIPVFFGLFLFWKIWKQTSFVKSDTMDIWSGKVALDAESWPERVPKNLLQKFWYWIA